MKLKYFLRGLGVGILFSAIILALSFYNKPKENLTKDEILERARKFGLMTEDEWKESRIEDALHNIGENPASQGAVSVNTATNGALDENQAAEASHKPSDEQPKESSLPKPDKTKTPEPDDSKEEQNPDNPQEDEGKTPLPSLLAEIVVTSGMVSSEVAEDLESKGIVDDAYDFDKYMCDNGFAPQIQAGTFYVPKGATYLEIAEILMKK